MSLYRIAPSCLVTDSARKERYRQKFNRCDDERASRAQFDLLELYKLDVSRHLEVGYDEDVPSLSDGALSV